MASRAEDFARLGAWRHAVGLREAALLLKPDAAEQRTRVVRETCRLVTARWPRGTVLDPARESFRSRCRRRLTHRRRALEHVTYLVRNRQVTIAAATQLAYQALHSVYIVRCTAARLLGDEDRRRRLFLTEVFPRMLKLPSDSPYQSTRNQKREAWQRVLVERALCRCDGNFYRKEDLDLICKLLLGIIPEDIAPSPKLAFFLSDVPYRLAPRSDPYNHYRFTEQDFLAFLSRLEASARPHARTYAALGRLTHGYVHCKDKQQAAELLAKVDQAIADSPKLPMGSWSLKRSSVLYTKLAEVRARLRWKLRPPGPHVAAPATPKKPRTMGRMAFQEIPLRVKGLSGDLRPFKGARWRALGGWGGVRHLRQCGGLDVMWNGGVVLFGRSEGVLEEVFVDREPYFCDVQWDGKHIWIGTRYDGVWVVSPAGRVVARIGPKQGLPPADRGMLLCSVAPGKVLAVGAFGPHQRAWCAMVEWTRGKADVNVFHRATRVPLTSDDRKELAEDINLVFVPSWIHRLNLGGQDDGRHVLVGRYAPCLAGRRRPLQIDLKTLTVSIFPHELRAANSMRSQSYFSQEGKLLEAKWVLPHKGRAYLPGMAWFCYDVKTWKRHRLNPGRLPYQYHHGHFGVSAIYGLVAWHMNGAFYRIRVTDRDPASPPDRPGRDEPWVPLPGRVIEVKQRARRPSN